MICGMRAAYSAATVLMDFNMRNVNDKPFKFIVCIVTQKDLEQLLPNTLLYPSAKTLCNRVPIAIKRRQATPRRTCAKNPKYGIEKLAIIESYFASVAILTWKQWGKFLPYRIGYIVPWYAGVGVLYFIKRKRLFAIFLYCTMFFVLCPQASEHKQGRGNTFGVANINGLSHRKQHCYSTGSHTQ